MVVVWSGGGYQSLSGNAVGVFLLESPTHFLRGLLHAAARRRVKLARRRCGELQCQLAGVDSYGYQ